MISIVAASEVEIALMVKEKSCCEGKREMLWNEHS
jgi:hypothetical protein